jgi:hypothetical protein
MSYLLELQSYLIQDDLVGVCGDITAVISAWESNVDFKMFSREATISTDPIPDSLIQFSQNAALDAHTCILEDG